jgi:hypothetical protein
MKPALKNAMIVLSFLLLIACVLFWKQVWGIFAGMSVLEAMNTIVTFILHVAVATIAAYAVTLVPEYVSPWLKALRWKRRQFRRGRASPVDVSAPRMPKLNGRDQMLLTLMRQMSIPSALTGTSPKRKTRLGEDGKEAPIIRLDL